MLTTVEAGKALGVSDARVRQMILSGAMRAEKKGRDLLIPQSEVEKAKKRQTKAGRPKKDASKKAKKVGK